MAENRSERIERRWVAILAADVVGFSRLMQRDEEGTHRRFRWILLNVVVPILEKHQGRLIKSTGDGFVAEFPNPPAAVRAAIEFQKHNRDRTSREPKVQRMLFRVGMHVGEVIVDDEISGNVVITAVRLEGAAKPGGICISSDVYNEIRDEVDIKVSDRGAVTLKNIAKVHAYDVVVDKAEVQNVLQFLSQASIYSWPWVKFALIALTGGGVLFADVVVASVGSLLASDRELEPVEWILLAVACATCIAGTAAYAYLFADRDRRSQFTSHFLLLWRHSPPVLSVAIVFALVLGGIRYSDGATTLLGVLVGLVLTLKWSESSLLPELQEVLSTIKRVSTALIAMSRTLDSCTWHR
jgi:class 3 adenylate cyclase